MNPQKTGELICKLRKENNMTQKDLADKLQVTPKAVSRWETGRGYPDIEILPKLSKVLNVSINELLNGELSIKEDASPAAEEKLVYICNNAAQNKNRSRKKIIWLSIGLGVAGLFVLLNLVYILTGAVSIITSVDPKCVVARDYSYIIYNNEKFLPVDTKGYTFCEKDLIVEEATVEGTSIFGKLLFGDRIYSVTGVDDNAVIYLDTDYDFPPSDYYVKESELENIEKHIENFAEEVVYGMDIAYALFSEEELTDVSTMVDDIFWSKIFSITEATAPDTSLYADDITYQNNIAIIAADKDNMIFKAKGEIIRKDNKYYWVECKENSFNEHYTPYKEHPYPIPSAYYEDIESLFLAINNQ